VWTVGGPRTPVECGSAAVGKVQRSDCNVDGMDAQDG